MRVLFLTGEFPPMQGGVGDCTNEIANALAQRGVDVSILTTNTPSPVTRHPSPFPVFRTIQKWNWFALSQIRRAIDETRADIVHIQYQTGAFNMHPMINFAPRLLTPLPPLLNFKKQNLGEGESALPSPDSALESGEGLGVRRVVTFHDLRPMYLFPKAGRVRDWVTFQLARASDAVIATNNEDFNKLFALNLKLLTCIPIGSNISPPPVIPSQSPEQREGAERNRRDALRAKLGVTRDEILLCYFGFLNDSKGGETLIHALAEIPNARLLMLGGQTGASDVTNIAYLNTVRETIDVLRLTPRVIWTNFMPQSDISAHFLASDICVLPYREGASYRRGTFMAALAHGMAIVTTKAKDEGGRARPEQREGMKDEARKNIAFSSFIPHPSSLPALLDSENVLLIPPDDPRAIADAVKRIAASPELRAKLQHGARATAQFFTWDKIADAHVELYEKLVAPAKKLTEY